MFFVDACHEAGIGVIIDWVPAHFPKDAHGLAFFDGTALYEHADPRQGEHLDWGTLVFNFGRNEVREFLIASALFWLKQYHIDGLRVDAVASMLYLDYSRKDGRVDSQPLRRPGKPGRHRFPAPFQRTGPRRCPAPSPSPRNPLHFQRVSRPVYAGGLGFTMKWNMGWMHDMLHYFSEDPVHRKYHHNNITFSMLYAFTENFVLPISHDEVVYGKRSLLSKMPGDQWQKFANVRAFLAYMYAHPGKKLLFMGTDIGDYQEWNHDSSVPWELLQYPIHAGLQLLCAGLNRLYRSQPALYQVDFDYSGFEWIDIADVEKSIISFLRRARGSGRLDRVRLQLHAGSPAQLLGRCAGAGLLSGDSEYGFGHFGGSNMGNGGGVMSWTKKRTPWPPLQYFDHAAAAGRCGLPMRRTLSYDVIIVGGGHNGLVTAAYLARAGKKVLVLERREMLGGCAVTEEIWPGYRVSTGAYLVSLLQERIVRELELERFGYRVLPKDPAFFSAFPDGRHLFFWQDEKKTLAEIAKFSAARCRGFPKYEAYLERLAVVVESLLLVTPPELPPRKPGDFIEYLKLLGAIPQARAARDHRPGQDLHAKRGRFSGRMVRIAGDQSHARHRWRDRRERRPAFRRHRLHPDASLHGRRGGQARTLGIRERRHGRGFRGHCRIGAQPGRRDPHECRRSSVYWSGMAARAASFWRTATNCKPTLSRRISIRKLHSSS